MRNDSDLEILWYADMNDVLVYFPAFDARSGRLAGFGTLQLEYQIAAPVRLNRLPTDAVSRLSCFERINVFDTLPRAPQDPVHGD